jgi:hypothetical protein
MPLLVEIGTLATRCKRRADKENDDHISAAEWLELINEVWRADVYSVVAGTGLRYFETTATLTTDGSAYVAEPSNCFSTIRLDYVDSAGRHYEVDPVPAGNQAPIEGETGSQALFYAHVDDRIYLYPTPPTAQTYSLLYVPQAPDVSGFASDECVDVYCPDGEACLIWGVAALAKIKASQDASIFLQKQEMHRERLMGWAVERALSQPLRRADTAFDDVRQSDPASWRFR